MEANQVSKEVVWLHRLCSWIGFEKKEMKINCDSQSAIFLETNQGYHSKTKHIDVQCHFMRDMVERKKVTLKKVDTLENITYYLTNYVSVV
jgi:hypothetical protein